MGRRFLTLALGLLLVAATPAEAGAPDVGALAAGLKDPDLDIAYGASEKLKALGAAAAPALPALVAALERALPPGMAAMHWHDWMGVLPQFHRNVMETIDAIAPKDTTPVPGLLRHLASSHGESSLIVGMLLRHWPQEPAAKKALLAVSAGGFRRLDDDVRARLWKWLEAEGDAAIPGYAGLLENGRAGDALLAAERLHGMGAAGLAVLVRRFEKASVNERGMLLDVWAKSGRLPDVAMPIAIRWCAWEGGDARVRAIAASTMDEDAVAAIVAKELGETKFHFPGWVTFSRVAPNLSRRAGNLWFQGHRPAARSEPFDETGRRRTALLGGKGGDAFEVVSEHGTLVGFRYTHGTQNWKPVIRSIQPLFDTPDGPAEGRVVGKKGPKSGEIRAIDGYAVAGVYAQATDRFEGFAVRFMQKKDDRLDPSDAYVHAWHGGATVGSAERLIGGEGHRLVGIVGRSGADVDALGLVEAKRADDAKPTDDAPALK